jgi:tetratricopeptide (TPR) repeat protein
VKKETTDDEEQRRNPASLWMTAGLAVVVGGITWLIAPSLIPAKLPVGFPQPPELGKANPAARKLLGGLEKQARRHAGDAAAVGELGIGYHANDYFAPADSAYRLAARLAPGDYQWPYFRSILEEESGNEAEQFDLLEQTVRLKPDFVPALLKLADASFKKDRLDDAARYYQLAAQASGRDAQLQPAFGLGRVAARREDWKSVVADLAPLPLSNPSVLPPYQLLQKAYEALGQADKAAEVRDRIPSTRLTDVPPARDPLSDRLIESSYSSTRLLKQAGLLSRFGYSDRALQVARRAAEANPSDADIHNFIAHTLITSYGDKPGDVDEALAQVAECIRLKPDDLTPLWNFTTVFFDAPKSPAAVERLRGLLRPNADRGDGHYYLGLVAEAQEDGAEALSQYQAALQKNPDLGAAYNKLGVLMDKAGKPDLALGYFQKSVQIDGMNPVALMNLGVALLQREDYTRGMKAVNEVLYLKPHDPAAHFCMGFACLYTNRTGDAIVHFREGLRYNPNDAEAHFGLASALLKMRKREDAAGEAREALRLNPNYAEARQLIEQLVH